MAQAQPPKETQAASADLPTFTDVEKSKARQWFKKAGDCRERREYDYAIECFISGLNFWPEAVEDGHKVLRSLAVQRQQAGGKKPTMMEGLKKPMTGKDAKACMLNAAYLFAKDPASDSYIDGLLKNAARAGFIETLKWIAPQAFDSMRREKKPNVARFKTFRQALVEAAESVEAVKPQFAAYFYEQAVSAVEYLMARNPGDMALKDEQRDLSGRLTITRGKYAEAESFRDSLQDGDKQKLLHDADRVKQGEQTLDDLIAAARQEYEANPGVAGKLNALIDALLKREQKPEEDQAIRLLNDTYQSTRNYSFKMRADDVLMRQRRRELREIADRARASGSPDDAQQARLAMMDVLDVEAGIYRERCAQYPTDYRLRFRLGETLFRMKQFDEAIPVLQEAQNDPRTRTRCQVLLGRCFYEKQTFQTAVDVLGEALTGYDIQGDDLQKEILYWLARAQLEAGATDDGRSTLSKLLRYDYNYADGDARKRLEALK
ncbi:MAG: hypothetical protein U1D55_02480 [Phycisphaerae bacterium]